MVSLGLLCSASHDGLNTAHESGQFQSMLYTSWCVQYRSQPSLRIGHQVHYALFARRNLILRGHFAGWSPSWSNFPCLNPRAFLSSLWCFLMKIGKIRVNNLFDFAIKNQSFPSLFTHSKMVNWYRPHCYFRAFSVPLFW